MAAAIALFRILGELSLPMFDSWRVATRWGLAVMFLFTAASHFTPMKADLLRMIPDWIPWPRFMLYFTGVCEALGAIGLLIPGMQVISAIGLILLLVVMFPANINAARRGVTIRGRAATPLWIRTPMQIVWIAMLWWSAGLGQ